MVNNRGGAAAVMRDSPECRPVASEKSSGGDQLRANLLPVTTYHHGA